VAEALPSGAGMRTGATIQEFTLHAPDRMLNFTLPISRIRISKSCSSSSEPDELTLRRRACNLRGFSARTPRIFSSVMLAAPSCM
jgi:hypothetical protein